MTRALQQLIHVGCRELKIDTETRHVLQQTLTGKASLSEMTEPELELVVNHLKGCGFRPGKRRGHKPAPRKDLRLIHVLWSRLGRAGALEAPGRAGLNVFIRRRFGDTWGAVPADVDQLRDWQQIDAVLQALIAWGKREKIDFDWESIGK